jgi:hypothetical protein
VRVIVAAIPLVDMDAAGLDASELLSIFALILLI